MPVVTEAFARRSRDQDREPIHYLAKIGAALLVGPLFAYLVWAVLNRRPRHVAFAAALNVVFWIACPAIIARSAGVL